MPLRSRLILAPALVLGLVSPPAPGQEGEPLAVRAQVAPGVYYVGEAIEVQVGVVAEGKRPAIIPPKVAGAHLSLEATSLRPISASGIGDLVMDRNLFLSRFRLVANRAGLLSIPPFRARLGERSGASRPLRITTEVPPLAGRPAEFLGGVGPFEIEAEARPRTLRAGQELEFQIRLSGPGVLGVTRGPSLDRFERVPLGLRIDALPGESTTAPPSRVFRYRLRPTRAGEETLPPVAVAAFEPKAQRYVTKVTPGVPIRVVSVPRFDPNTLDYSPRPKLPPGQHFGPGTFFAVAGAGLMLALLALARARGRGARRIDPGRLARRLAISFEAGSGPGGPARAITDGLVEYLALATARPRGALTPDEARRGIQRATGSAELARRAEWLITRCDQVRFAHGDADARALVGAAGLFFRGLGRVTVKRRGGGEEDEGPREAVETATRWV